MDNTNDDKNIMLTISEKVIIIVGYASEKLSHLIAALQSKEISA